jgi:hypothetical protein
MTKLGITKESEGDVGELEEIRREIRAVVSKLDRLIEAKKEPGLKVIEDR